MNIIMKTSLLVLIGAFILSNFDTTPRLLQQGPPADGAPAK